MRPLQYTRHWGHWRLLATGSDEDTRVTDLEEATFPAAPDERILPTRLGHDTALMLRVLGNADDKTCRMRLIGYMKSSGAGPPNTGRGMGHILWDGTVTFGDITIADPPIANRNWADTDWFTAQTYGSTIDACGAKSLIGDEQGVFLVPTLGYTDILCEIDVKDGETGTEAAAVGVMFRLMPAVVINQLVANLLQAEANVLSTAANAILTDIETNTTP